MFSEVYGYCKGISFGGIPVFVFYELSGHQITRKKIRILFNLGKAHIQTSDSRFLFQKVKNISEFDVVR